MRARRKDSAAICLLMCSGRKMLSRAAAYLSLDLHFERGGLGR